jgi:uncharacterized protein (TIGR01777 family)
MRLFISGGTGFVGVHLCRHFIAKGDHVIAAGTSDRHPAMGEANFTYISADTTVAGAWQERLKGVDAVINLTGKNIFKYWTADYKKQLVSSRIQTTRRLVEAMDEKHPPVFFSTSAIGYYGDRGEALLTEDSAAGDGFLASICIDWEKEAVKAKASGARVLIMRFGVILGPGGGALAKMIPAFKFFLGGPMASGSHWFPWVHIKDVAAAIDYLYAKQTLDGIFNFCSPNPVRNREFAKTLGRVLKRPAFMRVPALAVKLTMGEMGGALLSSQRGVPERLTNSGFQFQYPKLEQALSQIINKPAGP